MMHAFAAPWMQLNPFWRLQINLLESAFRAASGTHGRREFYDVSVTRADKGRFTVGDFAVASRRITQGDINAFADVTLDRNRIHLDPGYASGSFFGGVIAHGMLTASPFTAVLGTIYPGEGTIYLGQTLEFKRPVGPNSEINVRVEVIEVTAKKKGQLICLRTSCFIGSELVLVGKATVLVPQG